MPLLQKGLGEVAPDKSAASGDQYMLRAHNLFLTFIGGRPAKTSSLPNHSCKEGTGSNANSLRRARNVACRLLDQVADPPSEKLRCVVLCKLQTVRSVPLP